MAARKLDCIPAPTIPLMRREMQRMARETLRDSFGLRVPDTIADGGSDIYEREAAARALAYEAAASVVRQVGLSEARRLFDDALRKPRKAGPGLKGQENLRVAGLAAYDAKIADGVTPSRALREVAQATKGQHEDIENVIKRLKRWRDARADTLEAKRREEVGREMLLAAARKTIIGGVGKSDINNA